MTKVLFIILVTLGLVLWFKHLARPRPDKEEKRPPPEVETMARCAVCGINLPRSEALMSQGKTYCCEEHRRRDLG
ncbi:MAG: PP0621 family protein [Pseudomonadota bacterium]